MVEHTLSDQRYQDALGLLNADDEIGFLKTICLLVDEIRDGGVAELTRGFFEVINQNSAQPVGWRDHSYGRVQLNQPLDVSHLGGNLRGIKTFVSEVFLRIASKKSQTHPEEKVPILLTEVGYCRNPGEERNTTFYLITREDKKFVRQRMIYVSYKGEIEDTEQSQPLNALCEVWEGDKTILTFKIKGLQEGEIGTYLQQLTHFISLAIAIPHESVVTTLRIPQRNTQDMQKQAGD